LAAAPNQFQRRSSPMVPNYLLRQSLPPDPSPLDVNCFTSRNPASRAWWTGSDADPDGNPGVLHLLT